MMNHSLTGHRQGNMKGKLVLSSTSLTETSRAVSVIAEITVI